MAKIPNCSRTKWPIKSRGEAELTGLGQDQLQTTTGYNYSFNLDNTRSLLETEDNKEGNTRNL